MRTSTELNRSSVKVTKEENDYIKELYTDKVRIMRNNGLSMAEMKIELDKISDNEWLSIARSMINRKPAYDFSSIDLDINTTKPSKIVTNKVMIDDKPVTIKHTFY